MHRTHRTRVNIFADGVLTCKLSSMNLLELLLYRKDMHNPDRLVILIPWLTAIIIAIVLSL